VPDEARARAVLRRWVRPGWELDDPDFTAEREAEVLRRLELAGVPAPRLLGVDGTGSEVGEPAILESVVPGRRIVRPHDLDTFAARLAEPLTWFRRVPVDPTSDAVALPYRRFYDPGTIVPPEWAQDAAMWERAIAVARGRPPAVPWGFIHRDFHPGNVLWSRDRVSGVVDWTMASYGPLPIDLGHMRFNLAASYGPEAASTVLAEARHLGVAEGWSPEWDIRTALDVVPEVQASREPTWELRRIEAHVARALAELDD
jgi:aminoglycoside phosphotransferase (APT) family kinase protein